jgi:hypothetical protein
VNGLFAFGAFGLPGIAYVIAAKFGFAKRDLDAEP